MSDSEDIKIHSAADIDSLYRSYLAGEIDSTVLQEFLREVTPVPNMHLVPMIVQFMESRRENREKDPEWLRTLQNHTKDYLFFLAIMGNTPVEMSYVEFVKHAVSYGEEGKRMFAAATEEWKENFWSYVREIDLEISVFGDEF